MGNEGLEKLVLLSRKPRTNLGTEYIHSDNGIEGRLVGDHTEEIWAKTPP